MELDSDAFANLMADVYKGLRLVGYEERKAAELVDSLCGMRWECIKLKCELNALKAEAPDTGGDN